MRLDLALSISQSCSTFDIISLIYGRTLVHPSSIALIQLPICIAKGRMPSHCTIIPHHKHFVFLPYIAPPTLSQLFTTINVPFHHVTWRVFILSVIQCINYLSCSYN
ncbi:hypothetical protein PILCRDRAFT_246332 [Piloderma croceum F 1598]|uniref:Uncharacterized protein n=1 Tax=Piloderma croceum (strain F 1598) TaxID=765440 RepID=A0A0C3BR42_PILCF|nr:hypothetical protein PILCRDRAFT_246332 [Piloderma croceum F 1598]